MNRCCDAWGRKEIGKMLALLLARTKTVAYRPESFQWRILYCFLAECVSTLKSVRNCPLTFRFNDVRMAGGERARSQH